PVVRAGRTHTHNVYVVRIPAVRDGVAASLADQGIDTAIHYPSPVHLQPAVAGLGYREGDMAVSEDACGEVLTLPFYPSLDPAVVDRVASATISAARMLLADAS
ncbi:MAG: DegT/DnrJ/EryC1/StrS family aminotransferase, partial [Actinomycetota bacterium]